jgi:hypothetical protein
MGLWRAVQIATEGIVLSINDRIMHKQSYLESLIRIRPQDCSNLSKVNLDRWKHDFGDHRYL